MTGRRPIWVALAGAFLVFLVSCGGPAETTSTGASDRAISATSSGTAAESPQAPASSTGRSPEPGSANDDPQPGLAGRILVIDPGHNGRNGDHVEEIGELVDAGGFTKACNTVGTQSESGYPEATFTWELAAELRAILKLEGAAVVLTRSSNDGWGPCVDERGRAAAEAEADLLISLHADGNDSPSAHGFHVIAPGAVPGYTDDTVEPSAALARTIRDALVAAGFAPSTYEGNAGLITRADLGTLNLASVPAVIVECGNMRNEDDAALLESAGGRERIARGLADGIVSYLS